MKKVISMVFVIVLTITLLPGKTVLAEAPVSMGTVISGQEYSGTAPLTSTGNPIPIRFELPIEQNSFIRLQLYTQPDTDSYLYIENSNSPYNNPEGYGNFSGKNLTAVYDFYNSKPNIYSSSSFSVTADKRNTASYTEVYGDIAAGNYYIVLIGGNYRFRIIVESLLYQGTAENKNATMESATEYVIGNEQSDILITNGILNGQYFDNNATMNHWYCFYAQKGSYTLTLHTDGFFQGTAGITDSQGYTIQGNNIMEIYYPVGSDSNEAGTFEEHTARAESYTMDITIAESGTYYMNISRKPWTVGSYLFQIDGEGEAETKLSSIKITPTNPNIRVGSSLVLNATAIYSDDSKEDMTEFVAWKSSDQKIATMDDSGKLSGISPGTVIITASLEGVDKSVKVTVTDEVKISKLAAKKATMYLKAGVAATNKITATLTDGRKVDVTTKAIYKSSSSSLVIAKNGQLKAGKKGEYTIIVNYGGKKLTYKVVVK